VIAAETAAETAAATIDSVVDIDWGDGCDDDVIARTCGRDVGGSGSGGGGGGGRSLTASMARCSSAPLQRS